MEKRPRTRQCRNKRLPDGLTEALVGKIMDLRSSVKTDYLKEHLLSKYVSEATESPLTRRNAAIRKWLATERDNEATNVRLLITPEEYNVLPRVPYGRFVAYCRDLIRDLIGDVPPIDALVGSFSGGASTSRNRTESHPAQKYLGKAHVTPRAKELFEDLLVDELPLWLKGPDSPELLEVPGNVMFTVPKKTDIDRCACKEPDINMFMQKGVGNHLRDCLRRVGINLNDQSRNRSLARIGSIDGSLATLDLSSASDSMSTGLVALLLPECWHSLLDALRSPVTSINGVEHGNEMFSSMGNGFTFELESLLFYALARTTAYMTATRGIISVYGDDIICPTVMAADLEWVLGWFGFSVNPDKSFTSGPIRESCGGHYYDGYDITPFYIKGPLLRLTDLIHVANSLRAWAQIPGLSVLDPEVEDIWLWLKSYIPRCLWGGEDTSFKFQLVSNDEPSMRLQSEKRTRETGLGGYFHWLNTTMVRNTLRVGLEVETSSYQSELQKYRLKRVRKSVARLPLLFSHEIGVTPSILGGDPLESV